MGRVRVVATGAGEAGTPTRWWASPRRGGSTQDGRGEGDEHKRQQQARWTQGVAAVVAGDVGQASRGDGRAGPTRAGATAGAARTGAAHEARYRAAHEARYRAAGTGAGERRRAWRRARTAVGDKRGGGRTSLRWVPARAAAASVRTGGGGGGGRRPAAAAMGEGGGAGPGQLVCMGGVDGGRLVRIVSATHRELTASYGLMFILPGG
jgi:hypothetical protein